MKKEESPPKMIVMIKLNRKQSRSQEDQQERKEKGDPQSDTISGLEKKRKKTDSRTWKRMTLDASEEERDAMSGFEKGLGLGTSEQCGGGVSD